MLHLHFANRFERLSDQLLARLGAGRGGVFEVDTVIVPSAAVRRILTLALADAHAICAQVQFDFLAAWLWQQLGQVLRPADGPAAPGVPPKTSPEALLLAPRHSPWRIYSQLLDADFVASHARLAHYLNHADDVMRLELAQSVASLFDQYQSYRADWLQS